MLLLRSHTYNDTTFFSVRMEIFIIENDDHNHGKLEE